MTSPALSQLAALADPTRSRLLMALERQELAVSELSAALQLPQPNVSRHLKVLADDGWVTSRADGTSRFYRLVSGEDGMRQRLWAVIREEVAQGEFAERDQAGIAAVLSERRRRTRDYFSSASGNWDSLREELFSGADIPLLLAMLDPASVVADLGCGTGRLSAWFAPYVSRVIAVDGSQEMLQAARQRLEGTTNVQLHHAELERLPLPAQSVDLAVLSLVLPYSPDPLRVFAEAFRILRVAGRLIVLDVQPHNRPEFREQMGHVWPGFSEAQLRDWATTAGLTDVHYRAVTTDPLHKGPRLFTLSARRLSGRTDSH